MKLVFTYIGILLVLAGFGQSTQTVKGVVMDDASESPLPGVNVFLTDHPAFGTVTDLNGNFRLENVPIGLVSLSFSFISYEPVVKNNLNLSAGKELFVEVKMKEEVKTVGEVVITATRDKEKTINELAVVSARTLSVDEAKRYSGAKNDPARMAQNFAGVSGSNDSRNDIVIRGNSPIGVLWRMEGINIPSPNHFGTLGSTGGPVTMLNTNNLKDSDFMTAAFPAEYGNAIAGVFDLNLRNGNRDKFEFLGQVSFNGFEVGAEGPLSRKKQASFMINYRYSTLSILKAMKVPFGTGGAIPQYQDVTFKLNIPTQHAGNFTLFGIGGISYIEFLDSEKDPKDKNFYSKDGEDLRTGSDMGVVGFSHTYFFDTKTFARATLSASAAISNFRIDSLSTIDYTPTRTDEGKYQQIKYTIGYEVNHKFDAKNKINGGFTYDIYDLQMENKTRISNGLRPIKKFDGVPSLLQFYLNWQHRFTERLTLNSGLHQQNFFLNGSWLVEPRLNLKYQFREKQSVSFGFGLHSQLQPLEVYFVETQLNDGSTIQTNRNLDFVKSNHFVASYDYQILKNLRLKTEAYCQYIFDAAVEQRPSSFSMLNAGAGFTIPENDSLVNEGKGLNYGLEITLEKFLDRGYYILFTTSLFESKYKGSDNVWRNTAFSSNYILNLLGGKEFRVKKKHIIGLDAKVAFAGGQRYTEIDLQQSRQLETEVRFDSQAFEQRYSPYFRLDFKFSYTREGKRATQKFSCDLQNITNKKNIFSRDYNPRSDQIEEIYQNQFFPDLLYRIMF